MSRRAIAAVALGSVLALAARAVLADASSAPYVTPPHAAVA